ATDAVGERSERLRTKLNTISHEDARAYHALCTGEMERLRAAADELETLVPADRWPFPAYAELLFGL
ncbi:MAG: hypothetical protein ACLSWV_09430, partial [Pygmaiobacter massiliensis]